VNDFAYDKKPAIFENLARRISEIDRAFDAVTKTELFGQTHGRITGLDDPAGAADFLDNIAAIMRLDLLLDSGHYIRRAQIDFLARRRSAGD
jgi:hypothetical protein